MGVAAVALVGSYELLMMIIRSAQTPTEVPGMPEVAAPLREHATQLFAEDLGADRVPSVRAIRAGPHVGQPRAQQVQAYVATITSR